MCTSSLSCCSFVDPTTRRWIKGLGAFALSVMVASACAGDALCPSSTADVCLTEGETTTVLEPTLQPWTAPDIGVDVPSIALAFVEGDTVGHKTIIRVSNIGSGTLSGLTVSVVLVPAPTQWLDVQLSSTTAAPNVTADVTVDPTDLPAGTYVAELVLASPASANEVEVRVVVDVAPRPDGSSMIFTNVPEISWSVKEGDRGRLTRSTSLWITSADENALAGLKASVAYAHAPDDWVVLWMGREVEARVRMTVDLRTFYLPVGRHVAEVSVSSPTASNSVEIRVVVDVRPKPPAPPAPELPSALMATNSDLNVTLTWNDNSDDEDVFVIERRTINPFDPGTWSDIQEVPANTTSFVDVVPTADWYSYRIRSCHALGCSQFIGVPDPLPVPAPPQLEFHPGRSIRVDLGLGTTSAPQTVWMINTGGVPQYWSAAGYESPISWSATPHAGMIPPQDSMAVVMTAYAPPSWSGPPGFPFGTAMFMRDTVTQAWLGGIGLNVFLN